MTAHHLGDALLLGMALTCASMIWDEIARTQEAGNGR